MDYLLKQFCKWTRTLSSILELKWEIHRVIYIRNAKCNCYKLVSQLQHIRPLLQSIRCRWGWIQNGSAGTLSLREKL